jgi:integrase
VVAVFILIFMFYLLYNVIVTKQSKGKNMTNLKEMAALAAETGMKLVINGDEISLVPMGKSVAVIPAPMNVEVLPPIIGQPQQGTNQNIYVDQRVKEDMPQFTVRMAIEKYVNTRKIATKKDRKNKVGYRRALERHWAQHQNLVVMTDEFKDLVVDVCGPNATSGFRVCARYMRAAINLYLKPRQKAHLNPFAAVNLSCNNVRVESFKRDQIKSITQAIENMIEANTVPTGDKRRRREMARCWLSTLCFKFMLLTGARTHETHAIKWIDIDLKDKSLILNTTKGDVPRSISLSEEAITLLKTLSKKDFQSEFVFPPNRTSQYSTRIIYEKLNKVCGFKFTHHSMRKLYGQLALQNNASLRDVQIALGHTSIDMTARFYAHVNNEHRVAVANKVGNTYKRNKLKAVKRA